MFRRMIVITEVLNLSIKLGNMKVLGIESSCDETAVAVFDSENGLLGHRIYSQIAMHAEYGGVVPELASRDHTRKIIPIINQTLDEADINLSEIDGVAYTAGPGLAGALMVGASVARSIAWSADIPAIGVNHLEGHLLAPLLDDNAPSFPFVCLLVSGGHTQLIFVKGVGEYQLMGESIDDAVGEAFDKTAQLLGLGYPGGPALARLAEEGDPKRYKFPRPMINRKTLDFSFSGLKTSVITTFKKIPEEIVDTEKSHIARGFEEAVVETLRVKSMRAVEAAGVNRLVIAGGVAANTRLRESMKQACEERKIDVYFPRLEFCSDNGAMIAQAGCFRLVAGQSDDLSIVSMPRWPLESLSSLAH